MTLIVYRDGALYADNLFVVELRGYQQRTEPGPKLFMTPGKRAAIAILGQTFAPDDLKLTVEYLEYFIVHRVRRSRGEKDLPEFKEMDHIFNKGETSFFILTTEKIYQYKGVNDLCVLDDRVHHCSGTGAGPFNVCMTAGMEIEAAYEAVSKTVWSVSKLAMTIHQDDLVKIKPWIKRTDEEIDVMLSKRHIHRGHDRWDNEGGRSHERY